MTESPAHEAPREPSGVIVVDKPAGPTSHDVVGLVRRALRTKRVGHAGTLDPMASGVLVILAGEATKLGPYVTAHEKRYRARVAFGRATDTLDAAGAIVAEAEVPPALRAEIAAPGARIEAALAAERARTAQVPPAYSAIHVDGKRSYDLARAGAEVALEPRAVEVRALQVVAGEAPDVRVPMGPQAAPSPGLPFVDLDLAVSKGYYVRSLARDLGEHLGVPAHLAALRRTESGPFTLARAVPIDAGAFGKGRPAPPDLAAALLAGLTPLDDAARSALPAARLTAAGTLRTRRGQRLSEADFSGLPPAHAPSAWFDPDGRLVAVGTFAPSTGGAEFPGETAANFVIHRGFGP